MASNAVIDLHRLRDRRRRTLASSVPCPPSERARGFESKVVQFPARRETAVRGHWMVTIVLAIVAVGLFGTGYTGVSAVVERVSGAPRWLSSEARHDEPFDFREVVVRPGDTLWAIARNYGPAGVDIRQTVDWIRRNNQLSSATVYPGQVLKVPVVRNGR